MELLAEAPEDMKVLVMVQDHLHPGMFAFAEACECDTGMSTLGGHEESFEGGEDVFLVLPHGAGVTQQEMDNGDIVVPELN